MVSFPGSSFTILVCQIDLCPGNICPGNIYPTSLTPKFQKLFGAKYKVWYLGPSLTGHNWRSDSGLGHFFPGFIDHSTFWSENFPIDLVFRMKNQFYTGIFCSIYKKSHLLTFLWLCNLVDPKLFASKNLFGSKKFALKNLFGLKIFLAWHFF